jgi:hypothetical protein
MKFTQWETTDMCADHGHTRLDWIDTLAQVLHSRPAFEHLYHLREQARYPLHKAVREAVMLAAPVNWHELVLQWPHVSVTDETRLAYTRSVEHGAADRQTITTVNKYLTQHFPTLQQHHIRDIAAKYTVASDYQITHDIEQMLTWLAQSPSSCMAWRNWSAGQWHPYRAYNPKFGWGLAVRIEAGEVMARALINKQSMTFVRSFGAVENDRGHSQNDNALNSWLQSQGFEYADGWSGLKLAIVEHPRSGDFSAPYIDGDSQYVDLHSALGYLEITDCGQYECTNTDGSYSGAENIEHCEDCDSRIDVDHDSYYWVTRHEDRRVCESCCEDNYTYVRGQNGNDYYVDNNDAVYVESRDQHYHDQYLSDNNIVYTEDTNEYEHIDDCVLLDSRNEWVSADCTYAVYCEDSATYEHIDDCIVTEDGYTLKTNEQNEAAA